MKNTKITKQEQNRLEMRANRGLCDYVRDLRGIYGEKGAVCGRILNGVAVPVEQGLFIEGVYEEENY